MLLRAVLVLVVALVLLLPAVDAAGDGWRDDPEIEQPEEFNRLVLGFLQGRRLLTLIHAGETEAARHEPAQILDTNPDLTLFDEQELNRLGYELIASGQLDKAAVFELNALAFPESWNVHDSLGEALARRGDLKAAAASYSRSVELNPGNDNGVQALEILEQLSAPMPALSGPYLSQSPPGMKPQLFVPGVISSPAREHSSCTFSHDGRLLIFTRQTPWSHDLYLTEDRGDGWSQPIPVPFSSDQSQQGPWSEEHRPGHGEGDRRWQTPVHARCRRHLLGRCRNPLPCR